jgi:hypothetical protein
MKFSTSPDHTFNYDDVFFRDLTACLLDTIDGQLTWVNRFSTGNVQVRVPIFYSMTGDEKFLLDSFSDDIVSNSRYVELNTSMIPRGHVTMTSNAIKSDEFANPNVWLKWVREDKDEIRKILTKIRAIPLSVKYDLEIMVKSEIDSFKCQEAIMNMFWLYKYMYFEHNFMSIDAVLVVPDDSSVEIVREQNLSSDNTIKIKTSFEVHTYYPAVRPDAYNYNKNKLSGGGKDGIASDMVTNNPLDGGDFLIPKKVKWRNHTNRSVGYGEVEANYLEGTYAIDKTTGEVVAIIENVNNTTFKVARTYKLKDVLNIADLLRPANQYEIDDFILAMNGNYASLNVTYTTLPATIIGLVLDFVYYTTGTVSIFNTSTQSHATVSFWSLSSYSTPDFYNATVNATASSLVYPYMSNLRLTYDDSSYVDYIGGYNDNYNPVNNSNNKDVLIHFGINRV